ncbi:MAG TPA: M24 family metallopeptidase [Mycobacteriales bacterium]|nr:M24 family metallopeptidase [Mycobacteriales bacterium]
MTDDIAEKRRRVHALLDSWGLDAVVLRSPANIAWYADGARTHILPSSDVGVADLVVTRDGERVITHVNEADRLMAEEFATLAPELTVVGWAEDRAASLPSGRLGCDAPLPGTVHVAADIEFARRSLTEVEQERFRELGHDAAAAFTDVAMTLRPDTTEHAAAAALSAALIERGADPLVLLVAGGERLAAHRHPLPTTGPVGPLVMLVACGRRHGLIANLTRFVSFGPLPDALRSAYPKLLQVEAAFLDGTRPGVIVGEVFRAGERAYRRAGFAADEATRHHQGGPTGYATRDYVATGEAAAVIETAQAFAWNPSVPSLKVEDTVLARADGAQVLTVDPRWPAIEVGGRARPDVLELA